MSLFVIADLHLSFGCNKPMDVFPGWKDYTQRLEQNWRSLVKESDTVVIAGDISWAMKLEETDRIFHLSIVCRTKNFRRATMTIGGLPKVK